MGSIYLKNGRKYEVEAYLFIKKLKEDEVKFLH